MGAKRKAEAADPAPLAARLRERIARDGPIGIADYMEACLADARAGYYATRQPIGKDGDFVTAPEISQIFGELVGLWVAAVWQAMGSPRPVVVAELGPGRGTLMADALRAWRSVPDLLGSASIALVETGPVMRETQEAALGGAPVPLRWCERIEDVPNGPLIVIANEFLDALPIRQFVRRGKAWRERRVTVDRAGAFVFIEGDEAEKAGLPEKAPEGAILETRQAAISLIAALAAGAEQAPVAALIIDYGHDRPGFGDTLQAVRAHGYADPLAAPGEADLTAHVDFAALESAAAAHGLAAYGPMPQGAFLLKLGLEVGRDRLLARAAPAQRGAIMNGAARLVDPRQMGVLFKVLALTSAGLAPPPPFGDT